MMKTLVDDGCILVVKTGRTFPEIALELGDFEDWIIRGMGLAPARCRVVNVEMGEALPGPNTICGAVISGSHAMVTEDSAWRIDLEAWIQKAFSAGTPLLGICYGHQILAQALGGTVAFHPWGMELGTVDISCLDACTDDPLFTGFPDTFRGHAVHAQTVTCLPEGAVLLAGNEFEPHHAFRMGDVAWGVQFHPEFNAVVEQGYIRHMVDQAGGQVHFPDEDSAQLFRGVEETPIAASLLRRFARMVCTASTG